MDAALKHCVPPLLEPDEPAPFALHNGAGRAPVLLVADHASNRIPRCLHRLGLDAGALQQHIAWDIGSADLALRLSQVLDAPLIMAGYSRLVVDLNRSLEDASAMPETSGGIEVPGNQGLSRADRYRRVHGLFMPYRRAIDEQIRRFRQCGIVPALIALHSFTPTLLGRPRPWEIGVLWDKDPRIPVPFMDRLRCHPAGISVGDNQPYSGRHPADYTIDHHAEAAGLPHVSIEVRQDLIGEASGICRWSDILHESLVEILEDPALYRLWQEG